MHIVTQYDQYVWYCEVSAKRCHAWKDVDMSQQVQKLIHMGEECGGRQFLRSTPWSWCLSNKMTGLRIQLYQMRRNLTYAWHSFWLRAWCACWVTSYEGYFSTSQNVNSFSLNPLVNRNYPTKRRNVGDFCTNYRVCIYGLDITPKKVQTTICYQEEHRRCKGEVPFSRGFSWTVETLQRDIAMGWPGEWRDLSTRHCLPWIQDSFAAGRRRFQPRNPLKVRVSSCSWRETNSEATYIKSQPSMISTFLKEVYK